MKRLKGFALLIMLLCATVLLSACFITDLFHEHEFGEWVIVKGAICNENGLKERLCSCGEKENEVIPATGHIIGEWVTDVEATCTEEGARHLE